MNLTSEMIPGIATLLCGAVLTFGAGKLCRKQDAVPTVKLIGVGLAFIGAILIFLP